MNGSGRRRGGCIAGYLLALHVCAGGSAYAQGETPRPPATPRTPVLEDTDRVLAAARVAAIAAPTPERLRAVADAYLARGILDRAFDYFEAALRLAPRDAAAHDGVARIWRDWGWLDRALTEAHRSVYFAPQQAAGYNTLGTILVRLGQPDAAASNFARARILDPAQVHIVSNQCYAALSGGEARAAIDFCHEALTLDPAAQAARNNLALAYVALGDFPGAEREFRLAGTTATAAYNIGLAYFSARRLDDAAAAFQRAWEADSRLAAAGERLRQVNLLRGRLR